MKIRKAVVEDSEALWALMRELAVFEKYIDAFAITPQMVRDCGFHKQPPDFHAIVAVHDDALIGMLVYYFLPWTARGQPAIYMKELFVRDGHRGRGVGEGLMRALHAEARRHNCCEVKWNVAPWNAAAVRFYTRLGAKQSDDWLNFVWES